MDVPKGHPFGADPKAFLEGSHPQIYNKLKKEIRALNGVKFQLALKVQLQKSGPDSTEEYTDPVLRHKQEALLQPNEINEALDKVIPTILETREKWTQRGSGWVINQVETLWLDTARYQPERQLLYSTTRSRKKQEGGHKCEKQGWPLSPLGTTISSQSCHTPCGQT